MLLRRWLTVAVHAATAVQEVRLFTGHTPQPLSSGSVLSLSEDQRRYLSTVMRFKVGDQLNVFNGRDGEWKAAVDAMDKKSCSLHVIEQTRGQPLSAPGPTLMFGVLKGARLPTLVEKATELGVGSLVPVVCQHCATRNLNVPKLAKVAIEASEQSRRLTVPTIAEPEALGKTLASWDPARPLLLCDERGGATPLASFLADGHTVNGVALESAGLLIGPEGGFAPEEFAILDELAFVHCVSLGANTLRAETAALAACAVLAACK